MTVNKMNFYPITISKKLLVVLALFSVFVLGIIEIHSPQNTGSSHLLNAAYADNLRPKLSELEINVTEYAFPVKDTLPFYAIFDGKNTIWIGDAAKSRLWKFNIDEKKFEPIDFVGNHITYLAIDRDGKVWYSDALSNKMGFFDPKTKQFQNIDLPVQGSPFSILVDLKNNVWVALPDQSMILRYNQNEKRFDEFTTPTQPSGPMSLRLDKQDNVWFVESAVSTIRNNALTQVGKIGFVNATSGNVTEFDSNGILKVPIALFFDNAGYLWISDHAKSSITRFDPVLHTFSTVSDPYENALPLGMAADKYGNIWIAQHVIDQLAVYDPYNNDFRDIAIPTNESSVEFLDSDDKGNIWFAEQRGGKLGMVTISQTVTPEKELTTPEFSATYLILIAAFVLYFTWTKKNLFKLETTNAIAIIAIIFFETNLSQPFSNFLFILVPETSIYSNLTAI